MKKFALFVASLILLSAACLAATEQTIFTLPSNQFAGRNLLVDSKGNIYGTSNSNSGNDFGSVFQLSLGSDAAWYETILYTFKGPSFNDGGYPQGGLIFDEAGNLYGTTSGVGMCSGSKCSTVFKLTPDGHGGWTESVIFRFYGVKGIWPNPNLVFDKVGNLYATAQLGGTKTCFGYPGGCGTVVMLKRPAKSGPWTPTVYTFTGPDGALPRGALVFDNAGNLYGTTVSGGTNNTNNSEGVAYKLTPVGNTWTESVIHTFFATGSGGDGSFPNGGVIVDHAGNLYGTTDGGGNVNYGVVFKLTPSNNSWTETLLHSFEPKTEGGGGPISTLAIDSAGNLYGTAPSGNANPAGIVFELSPTPSGFWTETILYAWPPNNYGSNDSLVWNPAHSALYGVSMSIPTNSGIVYEVTLP